MVLFLFFLKHLFFKYMSIPECLQVHRLHTRATRAQKRALDPCETEAMVSQGSILWVLGILLMSSVRAASVLDCLAISSTPCIRFAYV